MRREGVNISAVSRMDMAEDVEKYQVQHSLGPSQMWDAV